MGPFRKKSPPRQSGADRAGTQASTQSVVIVDGQPISVTTPYLLPKDIQEQNRLDLQHILLKAVLQNNYLAPLTQPGTILDVGCGTGLWAFEIAQAFPEATVMACDLIEPPVGALSPPANYQFLQADVLKGLPFPDQQFDFVHQRFLVLAIPAQAWPGVLRELVRVTRAGGWVEVVETQLASENMGPMTRQLSNWIIELGHQRGIECGQVPPLAEELRRAGLSNVVQRQIAIPVGKWGGEVGTGMQTNGVAGMQALKPLIISHLGVATSEFDRVLALSVAEYDQLQMSVPYVLVYGQRPF
ncbi:MAG TPA: class I SAM-dependent methyltransferase [Ktedonobacteraceae bacterium]